MKHSFSKVHVKMSRPIPTSTSVETWRNVSRIALQVWMRPACLCVSTSRKGRLKPDNPETEQWASDRYKLDKPIFSKLRQMFSLPTEWGETREKAQGGLWLVEIRHGSFSQSESQYSSSKLYGKWECGTERFISISATHSELTRGSLVISIARLDLNPLSPAQNGHLRTKGRAESAYWPVKTRPLWHEWSTLQTSPSGTLPPYSAVTAWLRYWKGTSRLRVSIDRNRT